jgi:hypothetical protein
MKSLLSLFQISPYEDHFLLVWEMKDHISTGTFALPIEIDAANRGIVN